jgi:hypothetical protein
MLPLRCRQLVWRYVIDSSREIGSNPLKASFEQPFWLKEAPSDHHEGASGAHRSGYFRRKAALPVYRASAAMGFRPQSLGS